MLQKVVEYKVITVRRLSALEKAVNDEISNGFVPSGPVFMHEGTVNQVMVRFGDA